MAGKIKGITITLGADVQPLNKALEDVNKKSRDLQGELRQVERLLKLDPGNTELVAQKQKILAEAVENSKEKLDRLKTAQQQVNEQFAKGEINEEQYRAFQREVSKAEQELKGFEKQLSETAKASDNLKDKLDKAQTSLKDFGAKMTGIGKNLTMSVTAPIVAVGAASFKMAADLQDALGATDQIFKSAADSVKQWADNLDSYYGIAEGEALEYANMMGSLLQNIGGLTEEEAAKQAQTLIELAGDLTAMYGGTTADAVRALTGALKGNNSMLDNYGIAANDALIKQKALEMGIYDGTGALELQAKQAATLALIMEQTGAAQGQAAREADGASGGMRAFATEIKNLSTDIGEVLLPVITPLLGNLNDIVKKFGDLSPEMKKAIVIVGGLAAAVGPLLILLGTLSIAIGAISLPVVAVIAGIAALGAAIVWIYNSWKENGEKSKQMLADFGVALQQLINKVTAWLKEKWAKILGYIKEQYEKFVETWTERLEFLKGMFTGWKDAIIEVFTSLKELVTGVWSSLWEGITGLFERNIKILLTATLFVVDWMLTKWSAFKEGLTDIWGAIVDVIYNFVNNIISMVNKIIEALNTIQVDIPDWVPGFGGRKFGIDIEPLKNLEREKDLLTADQVREKQKQEMEIKGKITVEGVTADGDFVAAVDLIWDQLMQKFAVEGRT